MSGSLEENKATISPSQDDGEGSLLDILVVLSENARLLVFWPLAAGLLALGYAFMIPPSFTATTKILPPQQQQSTMAMLASQLGGLSGLSGAAGLNLKNPADLYVALIKSRSVADRIIDRFNLIELYEEEFRQDARRALENVTNVTSGKDGLITIEAGDRDPKRAADMANAYVEELFRLHTGLALTEAQQRRLFFEKELRKAHEELKAAQLVLGKTGVGENLIKTSPEAVVAELARLKALVAAQQIKISTMRGFLTEQSPEFRQAQRELASLRTQLAQADRDEPAQGSERTEYLNRYRDFKYHETLFELMAKQYEVARLDEAREGAVIQVVDQALPPERRSSPKRALIAILTTLMTGFILIFLVLVREGLRNAFSNPRSAGKLARFAAGLRRLVWL